MENAIRKIIENIPKGKMFDSHYVIEQLKRDYLDVYNDFVGSKDASPDKIFSAHGRIGIIISGLVVKHGESGESWSENINGNSSECTSWRR